MYNKTNAKQMSPDEIAKCRETLKRQSENRYVDEELLQRAWESAHQLATVLYQDYGASKVAVFGSLTEPRCFTEKSDIDIVVWGISYNKCLDALWDTNGLSPEFKIDIADFETSHGVFQQHILNQAIPIDKDDTDILKLIKIAETTAYTGTEEGYILNRDRLIQRITDELTKIERTVRGIGNALNDINVVAANHRKYVEKTIASDLAGVYMGIEQIFERVAREMDMHIPSGSEWHKNLLKQMSESHEKRPPIISPTTYRRLNRLLKFRHRVKNIYRYELIYVKAEKRAKRMGELFKNVSDDLDVFIAYLNET